MWYTLFEQESGAYVTHTPKLTAPSETIGVTTTPQEPDLVTQQWDATARAWEQRPSLTRTVFSRKEFLDRFTLSELGAAMLLRRSTTPEVVGAIETFVLYVQVSGAIELTDAQTIAGVDFLATAGVLTSARRTAILTPEPIP
jgi:hypothetical protein